MDKEYIKEKKQQKLELQNRLVYYVKDQVTLKDNQIYIYDIPISLSDKDRMSSKSIELFKDKLSNQNQTLEELGIKYGLTKERARQILKTCYRKVVCKYYEML